MDEYQTPPPEPPFDESSAAPPEAELSKDARMWGMFCHLAALAGYAVPLGNIIGPLVVWLVKKEEYPFVDDQGKESLNFQISVMIYLIVAIVLMLASCGVLFPLPIAVGIADLVFIIIASIKANDGESYRYPLTIRFIK